MWQVAKVARDKWQEVGVALKFQMVELDDYEQREPKLERRLLRILRDWKARKDYPTIDALVTACVVKEVMSSGLYDWLDVISLANFPNLAFNNVQF